MHDGIHEIGNMICDLALQRMPPIMPNHVNAMPEYGHLDIRNSTVSYMGFPLGGFSEVGSTGAAIMFHDSSNFAIANSTIAFNFDEIYARNSSNFQITVNEVYANTRSGIDIGTGSSNFVISATTMCTTQRLRRCDVL
jgi:hypothetical protein